MGVNLFNLKSGNGFLDMTPNSQSTWEKIDKLDFIKIIVLCCKTEHQESKKATRRMRKNILKLCYQMRDISKYTKYSYNSTI